MTAEAKPRGNPNWKKGGKSPNPGGRPKQVRELLERARSSVPAAFELAEELIADDEADARVRLDAAKFLTAYGIGAPPKEIDEDAEVQTSAQQLEPKTAAKILRLAHEKPEPDDDGE